MLDINALTSSIPSPFFPRLLVTFASGLPIKITVSMVLAEVRITRVSMAGENVMTVAEGGSSGNMP